MGEAKKPVRLKQGDRPRLIQMVSDMLPDADVSRSDSAWSDVPFIRIRKRGDTGGTCSEARAVLVLTGISNQLFSHLVVRYPGTERFRVLPGGHPDMRREVGKVIAEMGRERFTRVFERKTGSSGRHILAPEEWNAEYERWDALFRALIEKKLRASGIDMFVILRSAPDGLVLSACGIDDMWDAYTVVPHICPIDAKAKKVDAENTRLVSFILVSKGPGNWPPIKRMVDEQNLHYPDLPFCKMLDAHLAKDTLRPLVEQAWAKGQAGSR